MGERAGGSVPIEGEDGVNVEVRPDDAADAIAILDDIAVPDAAVEPDA